MHYTLHVQGISGSTSGGKTGGSTGSTSSGSSGGKTGGSTSSGSTGGKNTSGSTSSGSTTTTNTGGSTGSSTGGKSSTQTIKKPADLKKLPPVTVHQSDGAALVMNMQDFCYLPNANVINSVAFQQCIARKSKGDDDFPWWGILIIVLAFVLLFVIVARRILSS